MLYAPTLRPRLVSFSHHGMADTIIAGYAILFRHLLKMAFCDQRLKTHSLVNTTRNTYLGLFPILFSTIVKLIFFCP